MKEPIIKIPIYNFEFKFIYGTQEEIFAYFLARFPELKDELDDFNGRYWVIEKDNRKYRYFIIREGLEQYIHHEALHAAWEILDHVGVVVSADNDEPLAYLMDYIANEITKKINSWIKMKDTEQMTS